jgi:hypothetical protein
MVVLAAGLGIALAAAITWGTSQLVRQRIGLASEPLNAGRRLLPVESSTGPQTTRSSTPRSPTKITSSQTQSSPALSTTTSSAPAPSTTTSSAPAPSSETSSSPRSSSAPSVAPVESAPTTVRGSRGDGSGDSHPRRDD